MNYGTAGIPGPEQNTHLPEQNVNEYEQRMDAMRKNLKYERQYSDSLRLELKNVKKELKNAQAVAGHYQLLYDGVQNSLCWRMTAPIRFVADVFSQHLISRALQCVIDNGLKYTINLYKTGGYDKTNGGRIEVSPDIPVEKPLSYELDEVDRKRQQNYIFGRKVKFSIIVPLYNTPEKYLRDMIDSVLDQTYSNWELCLADGSDNLEDHGKTEDICREYAKQDSRIVYKRLEKNGGISENTNECLKMATGDYIGLFDHDDILHPSALYMVMEQIEYENADFIYTDENSFHETVEDAYQPHYKPDYSPDTLRSYNYICHFSVFSRELFEQVGYFNKKYDGSQDYDYILRLTERAHTIIHIPEVLYFWRAHENSVASDISAKPYTVAAAKGALKDHLERMGLEGAVTDSLLPSTYKINYKIEGTPKISILIPNKDHIEDLKRCIDSIRDRSTYSNYEIIIIENNSVNPTTFKYYEELEKCENIRVVYWEKGFNYSAINNFGRTFATGEYLLLLNNDVEVITLGWLEEMLMFAQRPDVGAVGAMLYYPDDTIQHAGVILGIGGVAGHSHKHFARGAWGYFSRLTLAQNLSCVTAACLMIKASVYDEVGGLTEELAVAFNDVDFCLKVREAGYLNVFTPYAELYHYESKSRGTENTAEKILRFAKEIDYMQRHWQQELLNDPYYNKNLTLETEDFSFR